MQKKIFNLNSFTIKSLFLLVGIILSGCLPLQKTTECADNEAFDPARRKCVPTLGASTTSTIFVNNKVPENSYTTTTAGGAVTHSIAVSDAYSFGFSTRWVIHYSGRSIINNQVVATNTLSYSLDPSALFGEGNYVIEAIVYDEDGNDQIDSASWTVAITTLAPPTLTSPSPAGSSVSYTSESTSETLSLSITNPDNQSGQYVWYLDGVSVDTGNFTSATNSLSDTVNPSVLASGIHTLELELNDGSGNVFDNHVWTIIIIDPDLPVISHTTPNNLDAITVIDGVSFATGGYLDAAGAPLNQICIDVDNYDKVTPGVSDIDVEFSINGNVEEAGPFSSNQYCATTFSTLNLNNPDIGESKTLNIKVLRAGTSTIIDYRQISLSVRPKNIRPTIAIDSANSTINCVNEVSSSTFTGCTMTQSVNVYQDIGDSDYTDLADGDVDNGKTFAITITDPDITDFNVDSNYEVYFQLKKSTDASYNDLDGTNAYSTVTCKSTLGDGTAVYNTRRTCTLHMDAFNADGPIEPGIYLLKAFVRDNGSIHDLGNQKTSDSVSWEITVSEYQSSSITIKPQDTFDGDGAGVDIIGEPLSWVERSDVNCTNLGQLINNTFTNTTAESQYIIVHTMVQDIERDDFEITIEMQDHEADSSGNSYRAVLPRRIITRTTGDLTYDVESCFQVPQWTVSGAANDIVNIKVSVIDIPDSDSSTEAQNNAIFQIYTHNTNLAPTFEVDNNSSIDKPDKTVIAGYPFTIDPGEFSDPSITDGENVYWRWEISTDGGTPGGTWNEIPKANNDYMSDPILTWTPDPYTEVTNGSLHLRICLGDDGFGQDLEDCKNYKEYEDIVVKKSIYQLDELASDPAGDNLASWYDNEGNDLYIAYHKENKIYVEKWSSSADGSLTHESSISFDTEKPGKDPQPANDLSMDGYNDGTNKSLLIAYRVNSGTPVRPELRVRRIYIDNDKMSFHYYGLYDDNEPGLDLLDTTLDATGHTISEGGSAEETIITITDINQLTSGQTLSIRGTDFGGSDVNLTYGTNFCSVVGTCTTNEEVAQELASAINNSATDAEFSKTLKAEATGAVVTIKGFPRDDHYDNEAKVTPVLGQIKIIGTEWFLPFADTFDNLKIGIEKGDNAHVSGSFNRSIQTKNTVTFNQEIVSNKTPDNKLIIVTKGSTGNVNAYLYDTGLTLQQSKLDIFNLDGFTDINNLYVSAAQESSTNDILIWISGISTADDGTTHLSVATLNASNFNNYMKKTSFDEFSNDLASNLDRANVVARTGYGEEGIIALTTNTNNPNQNIASLLKISIDDYNSFPTANFNLKDFTAPKLNVDVTYLTGAISTTPIFSDMTKGDAGDTPNENIKDTLYFHWFELDSGAKVIKGGMFNIEEENITTDSAMTGSYPANIAP